MGKVIPFPKTPVRPIEAKPKPALEKPRRKRVAPLTVEDSRIRPMTVDANGEPADIRWGGSHLWTYIGPRD